MNPTLDFVFAKIRSDNKAKQSHKLESESSSIIESLSHNEVDIDAKEHIQYHKLYFDGASKGNPGKASLGFVIYDHNDNIIKTYNEYLGIRTNNYAEYMGLLRGLEWAIQHDIFDIKIFGDSQLVIYQMMGKYQCRNVNLIPIYKKCKELIPLHFHSVSFYHVLRNANTLADQLANEIFRPMNV